MLTKKRKPGLRGLATLSHPYNSRNSRCPCNSLKPGFSVSLFRYRFRSKDIRHLSNLSMLLLLSSSRLSKNFQHQCSLNQL